MEPRSCSASRKLSELAHVPVVVLTSSDSPRDRLAASQFGAACYLRKPSTLEQFLGLGADIQGFVGTEDYQARSLILR